MVVISGAGASAFGVSVLRPARICPGTRRSLLLVTRHGVLTLAAESNTIRQPCSSPAFAFERHLGLDSASNRGSQF